MVLDYEYDPVLLTATDHLHTALVGLRQEVFSESNEGRGNVPRIGGSLSFSIMYLVMNRENTGCLIACID